MGKRLLALILAGGLTQAVPAFGDEEFKHGIERLFERVSQIGSSEVCVEGAPGYDFNTCKILIDDRQLVDYGGGLYFIKLGDDVRIISAEDGVLRVDEYEGLPWAYGDISASFDSNTGEFNYDDDSLEPGKLETNGVNGDLEAKKYIQAVLDS